MDSALDHGTKCILSCRGSLCKCLSVTLTHSSALSNGQRPNNVSCNCHQDDCFQALACVTEYESNTLMTVIPDVDQHSLCCSCWEVTQRSCCCYWYQLWNQHIHSQEHDARMHDFELHRFEEAPYSGAPYNNDLKHDMQLTVEVLSCIAHNQEVHMLCSTGAIKKHARASKSNAPGNKAIAGIRLCRHRLSWLIREDYAGLGKVYPACLAAHLQGNFLSGPRNHEPYGAKVHKKSAPNLGTKGGRLSAVLCFVTARHPTFSGLQTYVKHAPSGGSAVTSVGMQEQPLNSCNAQQDRSFGLLQGIAGHAEVSPQSRFVAHNVVADGIASSLPMALIRCCSRNMQCNISSACSIFKHFCVIM
jgi:hypothetical protein